MARSSALRSPSARFNAPAGGFAPEIDRERRRGRGALSNASGRYEPKARVGFDDGWQSLEDLPPFATSVTVDATRCWGEPRWNLHRVRHPSDPERPFRAMTKTSKIAALHKPPRSSGTSTACSRSASSGTMSRVRSWVDANTTGAAKPSR